MTETEAALVRRLDMEIERCNKAEADLRQLRAALARVPREPANHESAGLSSPARQHPFCYEITPDDPVWWCQDCREEKFHDGVKQYPRGLSSPAQELAAAVELLREWCEQDGWTDTSVNDHVNACNDFIRRYDNLAAGVSSPEPLDDKRKVLLDCAVHDAVMHYAKLVREGKSTYIRENSRFGSASAWAELLNAVDARQREFFPERLAAGLPSRAPK